MATDFRIADALGEISTRVQAGQCILFLGSGVHAAPRDGGRYSYPPAHQPAMADELTATLTRWCLQDPRFDKRRHAGLQRVSLFYELGRSRSQLVDEVHEAVQRDKRPSAVVRGLAEMNFPIALTTNYDNLYEQALRDLGKDPLVLVYSPGRCPKVTPEELKSDRPVLFKLHGDAVARSLVITEDDYIDFVGLMTDKPTKQPIPTSLKSLLKQWTTLFVGYSLADYNLRILFRLLHWKADEAWYPLMYSVDYRPDVLFREVWEDRRRYLRFLVGSVWEFIPALYEQTLQKELQP